MRIYSPDQEEGIYLESQARTWRRSGFIDEKALAHFAKETETGLARTNLFFRILLFGFTGLCVSAVVAYILWLAELSSGILGWFLVGSSVPVCFLAEAAVKRFKFYRHGIEEALALGALGLLVGGCIVLIDQLHWGSHPAAVFSCSITALGAGWLFRRFGFLYAYFIGLAAVAALPFQFSLPEPAARAVLFGLLSLGLIWNVIRDQSERNLFQNTQNQLIQAVLFLGMFLSINLRLSSLVRGPWALNAKADLIPAGFGPVAYFSTYALTWLLPLFALHYGVRAKKRAFIDAGLITLILAIVTNKDYLGKPHYSWDPALLGILLLGAAVLAIRFLADAARERRTGFSSKNILKLENAGLELAAAGAALFAPSSAQPSPAKPDSFGGGSSGGGGAGRNF